MEKKCDSRSKHLAFFVYFIVKSKKIWQFVSTLPKLIKNYVGPGKVPAPQKNKNNK